MMISQLPYVEKLAKRIARRLADPNPEDRESAAINAAIACIGAAPDGLELRSELRAQLGIASYGKDAKELRWVSK